MKEDAHKTVAHALAKKLRNVLRDLLGSTYQWGNWVCAPNARIYPIQKIENAIVKQREIWAYGPTGAQFGYYEPLCPWRMFK